MAAAATLTHEVRSPYHRGPAYRYIRRSDRLPTYSRLRDKPLDEIVARVSLFNPTGAGTWWIAAYDPDTMIAWGVADIHEREVGSFSMRELAGFCGRFGLPIERDLHYRPVSLATVLGEQFCAYCRAQPQWDDNAFCEDCQLSDCVICELTYHRPELDENLQCPDCRSF